MTRCWLALLESPAADATAQARAHETDGSLAGWLAAAGFGALRYTPLPLDAAARGPQLVAATARRARVRPSGGDARSARADAAPAASPVVPVGPPTPVLR